MHLSRLTTVILSAIAFFITSAYSGEEVIYLGDSPASSKPASNAIMTHRQLTKQGASRYFVGLGIKYAVSVPLSFVEVSEESAPALSLLAAGVGALSGGLQISGGIRSGVGASMTYDFQRSSNPQAVKNTNWGLYRGGWCMQAIKSGLDVATFLIVFDAATKDAAANDNGQSSTQNSIPNSAKTLSLLSLGFGIAADALFIASVANSLSYTKEAEQQLGSHVEFHLAPILGSNGQFGGQLSMHF